MTQQDLTGRVVVITGGARGIGRATAQRLANAGCTVVLGDLDAALAATAAAEIGRGAVSAELDVTSAESWRAFAEATAEAGPVDALVNNAGIMPIGSILKEPDEVTRAIVDVNLHGVINGTKSVVPGMVERGRGHVVNVASAVGRIAVADGATYSASKFAVVGLSEALRSELRPQGVDVSVVLPTVVQTELSAGVPAAKGVKPVTADDVAKVIEQVLRKPKAEVWVPRWSQAIVRTTSILPRSVQDAVSRAMGADSVFKAADPAAREAYEKRARR